MSNDELPPGTRSAQAAQGRGAYVLKAGHGTYQVTFHNLTLRLNPALQFAQGGKILGYVTAFLGALAGLTAVFDAVTYPAFPAERRGVVRGVARSETRIDLTQVVETIRAQGIGPDQLEAHLCCMLAVSIWEELKLRQSQHFHAHAVPFLLLYHLRNAAAHGNEWAFRNKEPKVPFTWRHLVIDSPRKGPCFGSDVLAGDLLLLLMEVDDLLHPGTPKLVLEDADRVAVGQGVVAPSSEVALRSRKDRP